MRSRRNMQAALALGATLALPMGSLAGQAAVDPAMATRASMLAREGRRADATAMLGKYLATAPADGRAWLTLGRFYLGDAREWHVRNHETEPGAALLLDLAGSVLVQSERLGLDSALIMRGVVDFELALLFLEEHGWGELRERGAQVMTVPLPPFILELGYNLINSCPVGGVLATGSDLEALAVWSVAIGGGWRRDVQPVVPSLYASDARYRQRMADALDVGHDLTVQQALSKAAERRAVCLSPTADRAAASLAIWAPQRMVLVAGGGTRPMQGVLSVTALLEAERSAPSPWTAEVREVYGNAARHNQLLCAGPLALLGDIGPGCRR